MKKIRMNCTATLDETFADFLLSRRAKGLAEKTLESYSSQWKAVARHLDTGTDIAALQKADLDAMIVSMRDAGLSPNSINSYTCVLKFVPLPSIQRLLIFHKQLVVYRK